MHSRILRRSATYLLILGVWTGAVAMLPAASAAQDEKKETPKQDKKNKTKSKTEPAPSASPGALSTKDDPAQIGKRNINGGKDKLFGWLGGSREKEVQLGRQLAAEVEQQAKMVDDPIITEYINRVGQNIVLHSDAKIPFTIKVVDSDEVNAFALPGGFFFVNKGLILAAENESELAGVMAHEIAHVAARHAMENQGKGALINYGAMAGMIFGGPIVSTILQNGGSILAGLASLKFSRGAENEADNLGIQYLYASGYDPTGMATMFEKLASQNRKKPGTIQKLFSTHPVAADRRETSLHLVSRFPEKEEYVISTSEFQRVKSHLMRQTNAKAGVSVDYDQTDDSKPTLKKRQPESIDPSLSGGESSSDSDTESSSQPDGPPKLKKRDQSDNAEPAPVPSPDK